MHYIKIEDRTNTIDQYPNECPFCHNKIQPIVLGNNIFMGEKGFSNVRVVFSCPVTKCGEIFIGHYNYTNQHGTTSHILKSVSIGTLESKSFHESIIKTSPIFIEIYNQAFYAEQFKLNQICGVGYRKALEFIIKDFCKIHYPNKVKEIESNLLGSVINTYIDDARIKEVAKRAAWLGNDETHYVKKWEEKDLKDLKLTIDLTLAFIQQRYDYDSIIKSMPDPKK